MSSDLEKNMRKTTEGFVYDFNGTWRADATLQYRAPECTHTMLPATLNMPTRNNAEFSKHVGQMAGKVTDANMTIRDYLSVPNERRSVCYTFLTANTSVGPYENEYIWFLTFDETGEKITKITEFLGSAAARDLIAKFAAQRESH